MRYLSVCSGIEAATVAWHRLGWTPVAFSEIEPFPCAVLNHHYPNVPNIGDMTNYATWPYEPGDIDLLVGGTPCQSFSVAGLRGGLVDPRGALMLSYLEIARRLRPEWIVWENVPGVLSSSGGRDFGSFLGALGDMGYGWAYRVLDAQWIRTQRFPYAVPQRRRRVFVVGCLGDPARASKVLFEQQSLRRDSVTREQAREEAADDSRRSTTSVCSKWAKGTGGPSGDECQNLIAVPACFGNWPSDVAPTLAHSHKARGAPGYSDQELFAQGGAFLVPANPPARHVAPFVKAKRAQSNTDYESWVDGDCAPTQNVFDSGDTRATTIVTSLPEMTVRRLTPMECERLQGFPDGYTEIPWRKKPASQCPDGPRYKALGNSMAVNCMEWIGERIANAT